ncbi:adenylate/guanylate cyclase domain-containing protein [Desulfosediminicola sp.]|uniref:adenylate/guanylate cyclase domain-containing protein n=1 Tax=Desulfosediminicola sp. TaxID=2886825 RepID=UPI003AF28DEB
MDLHLKNEYSRLKMFLWVSLLIGATLCALQYIDKFATFDALLITRVNPGDLVALPAPIMIFIIMFHTFMPGFIITEEGANKGILYTTIIWFFYILLAYSYASDSTVYVPIIAPLMGCIISIIRVLGWEEAFLIEEKEGIRRTLDSYVEPSVADMLIKNPNICQQGGERKEVTIMFADLRGFTKLCEVIPAEEVITMLRVCFSKLITIVKTHGGTVDKLIGDSMMVVWGNPEPVDNHPEKALNAALEMQKAMQELKKAYKTKLNVDIKLGIGINTDEVVAGTIGSEDFFDYTVLGTGVNLASRLESACPGDQICVSASTYKYTRQKFVFAHPKILKSKHYNATIRVYKVLATNEQWMLASQQRRQKQAELEAELSTKGIIPQHQPEVTAPAVG